MSRSKFIYNNVHFAISHFVPPLVFSQGKDLKTDYKEVEKMTAKKRILSTSKTENKLHNFQPKRLKL